MPLRPDLVEPQDGLDALVQEVSLPEQTAPVKSHQLLVEVHGEDVEVESTLHAFGFPQGHRAQRASFEMGRTHDGSVLNFNRTNAAQNQIVYAESSSLLPKIEDSRFLPKLVANLHASSKTRQNLND